MIKFQAGELLVAHNGNYYQVVECQDNIVSVMRFNGYTIISYSVGVASQIFQPCTSQQHIDFSERLGQPDRQSLN